MNYEIVNINRLKPLEQVFQTHRSNIKKMIESDGFIKCPILADKKTGIVLDGSHRYAYFLLEGYCEVPVKWVDYTDENIRVGTHLKHRHLIEEGEDTRISKMEVVRRGLSGDIYPPRTTRHFFPFSKQEDIHVPLKDLKKDRPQSIKHLISPASLIDEIKHNYNYLKELDEEDKALQVRIEENEWVRQYLQKQIKMMQEGK